MEKPNDERKNGNWVGGQYLEASQNITPRRKPSVGLPCLHAGTFFSHHSYLTSVIWQSSESL